jgi:hypothetical protein
MREFTGLSPLQPEQNKDGEGSRTKRLSHTVRNWIHISLFLCQRSSVLHRNKQVAKSVMKTPTKFALSFVHSGALINVVIQGEDLS